MKIISHDVENELSKLALSIQVDPFSWQEWSGFCLEIDTSSKSAADIDINEVLNGVLSPADCAVYVHQARHLVLMTKELSKEDLTAAYQRLLQEYPYLLKKGEVSDVFGIQDQSNMFIRALEYIVSSFVDIESDNNWSLASDEEVFLQVINDHASEVAFNERPTRSNLVVMLVEDDPLTRRIVAKALKQDYTLITAGDGFEALFNHVKYAPDLVFLDIGLPSSDGYHVLQKIKDFDPDSSVVMFSGNSYIENLVEALSKGADGFIPKPFDKDRIQHYLKDAEHRKMKNAVRA